MCLRVYLFPKDWVIFCSIFIKYIFYTFNIYLSSFYAMNSYVWSLDPRTLEYISNVHLFSPYWCLNMYYFSPLYSIPDIFSWISALVILSTVFFIWFFNLFISNISLLNIFKLLGEFLFHIAGFPCAFLTFKWIDCFFNYLFISFFKWLKSFIIFGSRSLTLYISNILVSLDLLIEKNLISWRPLAVLFFHGFLSECVL